MDVAAMSLSLSACETNTNISLAMMSKVLDTAEATSEAMMQMMDAAAVTPGLGDNINILV